MKALAVLIVLICGTISSYGQIMELNRILVELPAGDRGQFVAIYKAKLDPKREILTIVESRKKPDGSEDPSKGYYMVYLNDIDTARCEVQDMPNEQFRIFLPCLKDMRKSHLEVREGSTLQGEFTGTNISLGFWKTDSSRLLCQEFVDKIKYMVGRARPKPISKKSFDERVEFKCLKKTYYKFDKEKDQYVPSEESTAERKVIFMHNQIVVASNGRTEGTYQTQTIGIQKDSDYIEFQVKENDVKTALVSPNAESVTLIAEDFKIIFSTELIKKQK